MAILSLLKKLCPVIVIGGLSYYYVERNKQIKLIKNPLSSDSILLKEDEDDSSTLYQQDVSDFYIGKNLPKVKDNEKIREKEKAAMKKIADDDKKNKATNKKDADDEKKAEAALQKKIRDEYNAKFVEEKKKEEPHYEVISSKWNKDERQGKKQ